MQKSLTTDTNINQSPALLALKEHSALLESVNEKIVPMLNKLNLIDQAEKQIEQANASLEAVKAKRQAMLGQIYLGDKVDMTTVESEVKEATDLLAKLTAASEGATAARGILQGQLDKLRLEAHAMAVQVMPLQYAVMRERITPMAERYKSLAVELKDAYLELIGAAQAIDAFGASPSDGRTFLAYSYMTEMSFNAMNIPEFEGFKTYWHLSGEQEPYRGKFMQSVRDDGIL